jgi:hypothetical protein
MAYYDVLGLDSQCTQEEVKKAYRRLAIKVGFGLSLFTLDLAGLVFKNLQGRYLMFSFTPTKTEMTPTQKRR